VSCVVGIDLSTRAVDLVRLDETSNQGTWDHLHLEGKTALERLRQVPRVMPRRSLYWESVYLIAVEAPMSRGQQGTMAKLSRVLGAIVACLPAGVEVWEVAPVQWRKELGLSGHASKETCAEAVVELGAPAGWLTQDAYDAYAVAYYARQVNARALTAVKP
jgi:Holliday junction resolvasome RuvABC endonuclease subunit